MILLTGATGLIGTALLRRLTARREAVRCLVRDPRRLGPERVRVQLALGDLADPVSYRHALRGVRTVVHLGATARDQPRGTIEEIDALATWRLARAAAEARRVAHFIYVSPIGASPHHRTRYHRAKALGGRAVAEADVPSTTLHCSFVYGTDRGWLPRLERLSLLPAVPVTGTGGARVQPIWVEDVVDCILAVLDGPAGSKPATHTDLELAGPDTLTHREMVDLALAGRGKSRRTVSVPLNMVRRGLEAYETLAGAAAMTTWTETELLSVSGISSRGTHDAEALGVTPRALDEVLQPN